MDNADLRFRPLKRSALENGYVATVQAIIRYGMTFYESPNPFHGAKLRYPATAAPRQSTEPLSSEQKNRIFRAGVGSGLLDEALLRLLGDLTRRRLGLLVHEKLLKLPQMMQHWGDFVCISCQNELTGRSMLPGWARESASGGSNP
ncbi:hypothetical protein [Chelativorans composti]|uniref:Uncharacterized protein n=1 Tax=Chelativorans composti TaxID=768533 RepID=A0ABW5DE84_9HYPH